VSSIRSNLLFALLGAMLAALLAGAWATYRAEVQQADLLLDYHLRQIALALRDQGFGGGPPPLRSDDSNFDYAIQVWNEDGVTVYYSYPQHVFPNRAQLGYATVQTDEGPWRVFAMQSRAEVIQVAQPMTRRDQLAAHAAWQSLRPFLLLIPVMGALIWLLVGRGLAPIARLASAIGARTPAAPVALDALIDALLEEYRPLAAARNISVTLRPAAQPPRVTGDAASLRTLFSNLLDNALRYTPTGGAVTVALSEQGASITVSIEDSGPGIPPEERQRVFDRFYRRAGVESEGSGLGLAIVKAIAERHGFKVALDSAPAGGLAVRIDAPAAPGSTPGALA
jgi:anti-sigma regulatory factor (Ser/Thr protein kinase)